jgi:hypothetical protein
MSAFQPNVREENTHTPGQMLVRTNSGIECKARSGFEGPKVDVNVKPTSRAIYVVAAKNASVKNVNG